MIKGIEVRSLKWFFGHCKNDDQALGMPNYFQLGKCLQLGHFQHFLGTFGTTGETLRAICGIFGAICDTLRTIKGNFWTILRQFVSILGQLWHFWGTLGSFRAIWGKVEAIWGTFGAICGSFRRHQCLHTGINNFVCKGLNDFVI